ADLLEDFGGQVNRHARRSTCPAHGGDNPSALHYDERDDGIVWNCFTRSHGGSVYELVMEHEEIDYASSVAWLRSWMARGAKATSHASPASQPPRAAVRQTRYEIRDAHGVLVATHVREDLSDGTKSLRWERNGKSGLKGLPITELPLYGSERVFWAPKESLVF